MPKITLGAEERLKTIIQDLLDAQQIDAEGHASHVVTFETDARYEVLARNTEVEGIKDIDILRELTQRAIGRLKQTAEPTPANFIGLLNEVVQEYLGQPLAWYKIIFAINARPEDIAKVTPLDLFDVPMETSNWEEVQKNFEFKEWVTGFDAMNIFPESELVSPTFTPLIASAKARGWREGFNKANEVIDLFRAILNLVTQYRSRWLMGEPPLANILPSPIYGVFNDAGKFREGYYSRQRYKYQSKPLSDDNLKSFRDIVTELRQPASNVDILTLAIDAIQKYGQAMDAIEWREAFLPLWQILEAATLQTENIRMDNVVARLKVIFKYDALIGDLLTALRDARNDLIHRGEFSQSGLTEVMFLKLLVEKVIIFLLNAVTNLGTLRHLEWYYTYAPKGDSDLEKLDTDLEEMRKLTRQIREWRKPKASNTS